MDDSSSNKQKSEEEEIMKKSSTTTNNINESSSLIDRLSRLPDDILIKILSLLPTKYAVSTSALSKRWETLWASVTDLDFNQDHLFRQNGRIINITGFTLFVDRILHSYNLSRIGRFSFQAHHIEYVYLNDWISFVIRRKVEELEIDVSKDTHVGIWTPLKLPIELFKSSTLTVLKLQCRRQLLVNYNNINPDSIHVPSLKILHVSLSHPCKDLMDKLFCCFPLLEELIMKLEFSEEDIFLNVIAPVLKRLSICLKVKLWNFYDYRYKKILHRIEIRAPKLECLTLADSCLPNISFLEDSSGSLIKAFVDVGRAFPSYSLNNDKASLVHSLLTTISAVKILSLSASTLAVLACGDNRNLPAFSNLSGLRLDFDNCCQFNLLPHFFSCSYNIETLCLNGGSYYASGTFDLIQPDFLSSKLKSVEFVNCLGYNEDLKVIEYLLKNSKVLEKIQFLFKGITSDEIKNMIISQASSFPQASSRMRQVSEIANIVESHCYKWES